jgi:Fe-S-cluster containining protein
MGGLPDDVRRIVQWFNRQDPWRAEYVTPCYFLELATRKCLIYPHRPQVCRDFTPGSHACKELRRAFAPCIERFNKDMSERH